MEATTLVTDFDIHEIPSNMLRFIAGGEVDGGAPPPPPPPPRCTCTQQRDGSCKIECKD